MQIQWWEGAVLRCAETVLQSTTQDTVCAESWLRRKSIAMTVVEEARRRDWFDGRGTEMRSAWKARRVFELERVVSCRSADPWWRTKLNFGSGEPFDDLHRSTAFRAAPKIGRIFGGRSVLFGLRLLCRTQQLKAKRQERGASAVGQKAEITDAHEALWKDMQ